MLLLLWSSLGYSLFFLAAYWERERSDSEAECAINYYQLNIDEDKLSECIFLDQK